MKYLAMTAAALSMTVPAVAESEAEYDPNSGLPGAEWSSLEPTGGNLSLSVEDGDPVLRVSGDYNLAVVGLFNEGLGPGDNAVYKFRARVGSGSWVIGFNDFEKSLALTLEPGSVGFKNAGAWTLQVPLDTSVTHTYRVEKHERYYLMLIVDDVAVGAVVYRELPAEPTPFVFANAGELMRGDGMLFHFGYTQSVGVTGWDNEDPISPAERENRQQVLIDLYRLDEVEVFD